jgi:hypothetical protein
MQIVERWGGFILQNNEGDRLLVPGRLYNFETPVILSVRLNSTRAGNNAWWRANNLPPGALNDAPYNPHLRAQVGEFIWLPPASKDNRGRWWGDNVVSHDTLSALTRHEGWVVQGGSDIPNWAARVVAPIPDPIRDLLREIAQQVEWGSDPLVQRQGALEVRVVYHAHPGAAEMLPRAGSGYRALYNHFFYPLNRWVWRVLDETAYALLVPSGGEAYVVSPDHEAEWLCLVGDLFIARHPVPRRGVID